MKQFLCLIEKTNLRIDDNLARKKNKFFLYYLKFENQKSSKKKQELQLSEKKKDIYKKFSYFFLIHLNFSVNIGTKSVNTLDTCKIKNIFFIEQ